MITTRIRQKTEKALIAQGMPPELAGPALDCWFHLLDNHKKLSQEIIQETEGGKIAQYCFLQGFVAGAVNKIATEVRKN